QNSGVCTSNEVFCNGFPTSYQSTNNTTIYFAVSFMRYYLKSNAPALAKLEWKLQQKKNITYIMSCNANAPRYTTDEEDSFENNEDFAIDNMKMYPNPVASGSSTSFAFKSAVESEATVFVTNMVGQIVEKQQIMIDEDMNEISLPVEKIKPGYYMVTIANEGGKISKPLIIQ
nr:T9SS type A sorting domain-containing protein [Bacteroidia bacterium]